MYKAFIIDDEQIVRMGLKTIVDWKAANMYVAYEASNGLQALKIMEQDNFSCDIIFTDIKMPSMDGLELLKKIREKNQIIPIIVLSGYNDYELVRQAFVLGATDYILKTDLKSETVLSVIKKSFHKNSGPIKNSGAVNKKDVIFELLFEDNIDKKRVESANLPLSIKNLAVCFLVIDNYSAVLNKNFNTNSLEKSVCLCIEEALTLRDNGVFVSVSPSEYVIILSFPDFSENAAIPEKIKLILENIKNNLHSYLNIEVSCGISDICNGFENIGTMYTQALHNSKLRLILGKNRLIFNNSLYSITDNQPIDTGYISSEIITAMKNSDKSIVDSELISIFNKLKSIGFTDIEQIYYEYIKILFAIMNLLNNESIDTTMLFGKELDFYNIIKRFETIDEINIWFTNFVGWSFDALLKKRNIYVDDIEKAKEYIDKNYMKNISLSTTSRSVNLSKNYFSRLFSEKTGKSFIEYLTEIRINKAKELILTTNLRMYEISEIVGYPNIEHFSRIFKISTGYSPAKFKAKYNALSSFNDMK